MPASELTDVHESTDRWVRCMLRRHSMSPFPDNERVSTDQIMRFCAFTISLFYMASLFTHLLVGDRTPGFMH